MAGELRLWLPPDQLRTSAGTVVTTKTTERLDVRPGRIEGGAGHHLPGHFDPHAPIGPGGEPAGGEPARDVHVSREPLREPRPDVYLLLTMPEGDVVDTRTMAEGFHPNLRDRHLGTVEEPITFVVRRPRRAEAEIAGR